MTRKPLAVTVRLLVALLVLALAAALAQPGPRTVLLKPDAESFEPGQLAEAARVIERRLVFNRMTAGVQVKAVPHEGIHIRMHGLGAAEQERVVELARQRGLVEFRLVSQWHDDPIDLDDLAPAALSGDILSGADASAAEPPYGPTVMLEIHADHRAAFGDLTGENVGRRLAIVLDDRILTAPLLQARITDRAQISGFASLDEAIRIAALLEAGALPFDLEVVER